MEEWGTVGLGTRPDRDIADSLMANQSDVLRYRHALGIPAKGCIDWDSVPLGRVPANVLAEELGTSAANVRAACRRRGMSPSPARYFTKEALPCRSYEEAAMDALLHYFGVPHEHEVAIGVRRFRADFMLTETGEFLEVAGMLGNARYRAWHEEKRLACERAGTSVVWITGREVLTLARELGPFSVRFGDGVRCGRCGEASPRLRRGLCPPCYDRFQRRVRGRYVCRCSTCGRVFRDRRSATYCSTACRFAGATQYDYPPVPELIERACASSLKRVARELGIPYVTFCAYIRAHTTPHQRRRLAAADSARKRRQTPVAWPPTADLERLYNKHGSQWIADELGVRRGTVTRRIKQERLQHGAAATRLERLQFPSVGELVDRACASSAAQVARELGVRPAVLRRHLRTQADPEQRARLRCADHVGRTARAAALGAANAVPAGTN